jgi:hypothetical protein
MKKALSLLIGMTLLLVLPALALAHTEEDPFVAELIAGGGNPASAIVVGEVQVWNDGDYLYVQYVLNDGFCLTETHLHVFLDATIFSDVPHKNGNPIPGKFDYKSENNDCVSAVTYEIPLTWPPDTSLCIAAHAAVVDSEDFDETAWAAGEEFPGANWATYLTYTVQDGGPE